MTSASLFRMGYALFRDHAVSNEGMLMNLLNSSVLQFLMIAGGLAGYFTSGSMKSLGTLRSQVLFNTHDAVYFAAVAPVFFGMQLLEEHRGLRSWC